MNETTAGGYVLDSGERAERDRLAAQSQLWDPFTFRCLAETGVTAGWRCLEIGAGTGSVAAWLLDRMAPGGYVVATDVETRWLEPLAGPNLEVRHHNVAAEPLDPGGYDLIHARGRRGSTTSRRPPRCSPPGCPTWRRPCCRSSSASASPCSPPAR